MRLRFLGKSTASNNSPTLYATDRGSYLVLGWRVSDPEIVAKLDLPEDETCVEIYARLFSHLTSDGLSGVVTSWAHPIVHVTEEGNYIVQGTRLTDPEARAQMDIPESEDVVEVSKAAIQMLLREGDLGTHHG